MGNVCELLKPQTISIISNDSPKQNTPLRKSPIRKAISLSDFIIKSKIGEGSFGKVFIAQRKTDDTLYALKKVSKEKLLNNNMRLKDVLTEKNVMLKASHPFIVPLYFTF